MIYNCQIREKSLCVKYGSLYVSLPARQFLFLCMKTCMFFSAHTVEGKCGCLADSLENWHLWFCSNPFCLYLLTSIPKHQLEGLTVVTHAMFDGTVVLVSHHTTGSCNNPLGHGGILQCNVLVTHSTNTINSWRPSANP